MVTIILSPHSKRDIADIQVADSEAYCLARRKIREALVECKDIQVCVTSPVYRSWFWDLRYDTRCRFEDDISALKDKLKVSSLPAELAKNPEYVSDLNLLDLPDPNSPITNVDDWILQHLLGDPWVETKPSREHLQDLVNWALCRWDRNKAVSHPYLDKLKDRKKSEWLGQLSGELKEAYYKFFEEGNRLSCTLSVLTNLRTYPFELLTQWLDELELLCEDGFWISKLVEAVVFPGKLVDILLPKVAEYWSVTLNDRSDCLESLVSQMSGRLLSELEQIEEHLRGCREKITRELLDQLTIKFEDIPDAQVIIKRLDMLSPRQKPREPHSDWSLQEWLRWVVKEYIPYARWVVNTDAELDREVVAYTEMYEEWLYRKYPDLLNQGEHLVSNTLSKVKEYLDRDYCVVWLFLDNLSLLWADRVVEAFGKLGLSVAREEYQISMLPSDTHTSRQSAITGLLPRDALGIEDVQKLLWDRLNANVKLVDLLDPDLKHSISSLKADLYLWIYTGVDEWAHTPPDKLDHDIWRYFNTRMDKVTEALEHFFKALIKSRPSVLFVSSDHGSTSFLRAGHQVAVPKSAQEDDVYRQHRRFVSVRQLDSLNAVEWWPIDRQRFGLSSDYAVARGTRYIARKPRSFTHGGLLPEETITPLYVFENRNVPEQILLKLVHVSPPVLRGRSQDVELEILNHFDFPVQDLEVRVPELQAKWFCDSIDAHGKARLESSRAFIPISVESSEFKALVEFTVAGFRRNGVLRLELKIRKIYEVADLGDMFNDS